MYWVESLGRIELNIALADARDCSHSGDCQADVECLREKPAIRRQLAKIQPDTLRDCLAEYGAWDEDDLADHDWNLTRLLWLACCDIAEEHA